MINNWNYVKLGDISNLQFGYAFKSDNFVTNQTPVIRIGDITENGIIPDYNCCYSNDFWNDHPECRLQKNAILIAMSGATVGKSCINTIDDKLLINQRVAAINVDKEYETNYVFYSIKSNQFKKYVEKASIGCAQPNISGQQISNFVIPMPPIEIQRNIARTLDKVSKLIDKKKKLIEKYDILIKSRFIEMFGDCKNQVLIGDTINISRGASPRPISDYITKNEDGVNWIKIGDVSENSLYITKTEEKITLAGAKKSRMVHKGDFILSNSMSFGRPYILGINGCVHDGWLIMSNFKNTFNELYLYYAIRDDDVQNQFKGKVNGATVKNLNSDLVKSTNVKLPPLELQQQFATFVQQIDKSKFEIWRYINFNVIIKYIGLVLYDKL